jgi:hypothetical protein
LIAEWALVILTGALVTVTIFYAIQTWRLVKVPFTPVLRASLQSTYTSTNNARRIDIEIENIGVGTAVSVEGNYSINESQQEIEISLLRSSEKSRRFGLNNLPPIENRGHYQENPTSIEVHLNFKNIFNHNFNYDVTLNVSEYAINTPGLPV